MSGTALANVDMPACSFGDAPITTLVLRNGEAAALSKVEVPLAVAAAGASHASLEASDDSWVVACADNKMLFAKLFTAGMKEGIEFTTRAVVKIGRSNAVQVSLNDLVLKGPAGAGQVSLTELTPTGSRQLAPGAPDDCTSGR